MNKGFIFDLDGVIVDTAKYHFLAWKKVANTLGFDFSEKENELLKGVSRVDSLNIILKLGNKEISAEEKKQYLISKNNHYLSLIKGMDQNEILPGIIDLLNHLDEYKIPYVLGSASKNARPILEKVGILHRFQGIVDGNDVTKAKPDPEVFLLGAEILQLKPKNCIVLEDSIAGIQAANIAKMKSIGIGDSKVLLEADYNFENSTEITKEVINNIINK